MSSHETVKRTALLVAQHLYDHDVRMFSFVGSCAALLSQPDAPFDLIPLARPIQVYVSMSSGLRVWEERVLLPFADIFTRSPNIQRGRWRVALDSATTVELEILRENPSFYLLGSPTVVSRRPQDVEDLKQLLPELPLLLADTLRDWRESLDNAPQAQLVRFFVGAMQGAGIRFGWRHPGPETTEIALEFLDELDGDDETNTRAQFIAAGLRLTQDNGDE